LEVACGTDCRLGDDDGVVSGNVSGMGDGGGVCLVVSVHHLNERVIVGVCEAK
jgi:hypothetical protein